METSLGSNIIFLTSEDQKLFLNEFVDALPWNSFGRKNVGYLFAIARGAKVIWDFDDDNFLKFWMDGAALDQSLDINTFTNPEGKYFPRVQRSCLSCLICITHLTSSTGLTGVNCLSHLNHLIGLFSLTHLTGFTCLTCITCLTFLPLPNF